MNTVEVISNFVKEFIRGFSGFTSWLITPIGIGQFSFAPLMLFGLSGLLVIITLLIIKLVNPLS